MTAVTHPVKWKPWSRRGERPWTRWHLTSNDAQTLCGRRISSAVAYSYEGRGATCIRCAQLQEGKAA